MAALLIASRCYPIVYAEVPKSGCTTIKNALYFIDNGRPYPEPVHIHGDTEALLTSRGEDTAAFHAAVARSRVCFSVVRDPAQRAYSAFCDKVFHPGDPAFRRVRDRLARHYGVAAPQPSAPYSPAEHGRNFKRFLRFVARNTAGLTEIKPNNHWRPQADILDEAAAAVPIDHIGRLETLGDDFPDLLRRAGYHGPPVPTPKQNKGLPPPFTLEEILDGKVRHLLATIYQRDYALFGYAPPR